MSELELSVTPHTRARAPSRAGPGRVGSGSGLGPRALGLGDCDARAWVLVIFLEEFYIFFLVKQNILFMSVGNILFCLLGIFFSDCWDYGIKSVINPLIIAD